jgi:hypothetical protein
MSAAATDKVAAMRKGWERCVLFATLNRNGTTAEDVVATAMRLCSDEEARYKKALIAPPVGLSESQAADETQQVHDEIAAKMLAPRTGG